MDKFYYIFTFGCQMNVHESEKLAGILEKRGYKKTKHAQDAEVMVFNTCCIRGSAEQRILGNIGAVKPLKRKNKDIIVAVCGCMSQQKGMADQLKEKFPFIDIIFGANNVEFFENYLDEFIEKKKYTKQVLESEFYMENSLKVPVVRDNKYYAYVNIMYGCNNFCTYCIVPYVRGREKSRRPEEIYAEVKNLLNSGYKVITLLGQNVNSYGSDGSTDGVNFATLLDTIANFEGDFEVRFLTSHPKDLSDELIDVMARNDKISKVLHLPVQAGSNSVLKAMNRKYTVEHYRDLIKKLKDRMPNIILSTDIIVGFPNESEEDFAETEKLLTDIRFNNAFIFIYSKRKGTVAEKLPNQIPLSVKHTRIYKLLGIQREINGQLFNAMVGTTVRVLVDGGENGSYTAKTQCGKFTKIYQDPSKPLEVGNFYDCEIYDYKNGNLIGRVN